MLNEAEQQVLDETARQLRADDPHLAQRLRRRPGRHQLSSAGNACLAVLAVILLVLGQAGQAFVLAVVAVAWWVYRRYQNDQVPGTHTRRDRRR